MIRGWVWHGMWMRYPEAIAFAKKTTVEGANGKRSDNMESWMEKH